MELQIDSSEPNDAVPDDVLERRLRDAEDAAQMLAEHATEAERLAAEAAERFRTKPSATTHADDAVQSQLRDNASAAARAAKTEASTLAAERDRRAKEKRIRELTPMADAAAVIAAAHARMRQLVFALRDQLIAEGRRVLDEIQARNEASIELSALLGQKHEPLKLTDVRDRLIPRLTEACGPRHRYMIDKTPVFGPRPFALQLGPEGDGTFSAGIELNTHFTKETEQEKPA